MKRLLFDLETNGLFPDVDAIHCAVVLDLDTGELTEFGPNSFHFPLCYLGDRLASADVLAGHNICGYDIPVLEKVLGWKRPEGQRYLDTLAMSRALFPGGFRTSTLVGADYDFRRKHGEDSIPQEFVGLHSLKAWSIRLQLGREGKADYTGGWEKWNPEMQAYCVQDVRANALVLSHFMAKGWPEEVFHVESLMAYHLFHQQAYGVGFDEDAAIALMVKLTGVRSALESQLAAIFPPQTVEDGPPRVAKAKRTCHQFAEGEDGWFPPRVKGETYQKYKVEEFNPTSDAHIARRLSAKYDWRPNDFTPGGRPSITADILRELPFPEAAQLAELKVVSHILGYISEGKGSWLKLVKDGRIHGRVESCGAVTHRASHNNPNLANVPKEGKPYGKECRQLFRAGGGGVPLSHKLVGADASSLQLAIYAHFVARYDGGALAALVEGGDPHEYMREASGLFTRERQKTLTYATWFGAGIPKQGMIVLQDWREAYDSGEVDRPAPSIKSAAKYGKLANDRMASNMKGYREMNLACASAGARGYILGLDGRRIPCPSARLALLTLLQGNEAVVMKHAYILACERLAGEIRIGLARPVLWVHDEFQWMVVPNHADVVGRVLTECITDAGVKLGMRLKLGAKYKVGDTWAETH